MVLQILKKSPIILCTGVIMIFASCNAESEKNFKEENTTESVSDAPRSAPVLKDSKPDAPSLSPSENKANAGATESVKLNPAHGEPGHDCAIPVGQPLTNNSGAMNTAPTINAPTVAAPKANSGNINPPHGQPGHDCAVPVGDPL